jgi:hypothetical protein
VTTGRRLEAVDPSHALGLALASCQEPQATAAWCASFDPIVSDGFASRSAGVDATADEIRLRYLSGEWDFPTADHAINMLAGYAQRLGVLPATFWAIYLAFDQAEYTVVDDDVLRAGLACAADVLHDPPTCAGTDPC